MAVDCGFPSFLYTHPPTAHRQKVDKIHNVMDSNDNTYSSGYDATFVGYGSTFPTVEVSRLSAER